jgi:hypothetical protein
LLVDQVDDDGMPVYRLGLLAEGDRAEARRQLVLDVLRRNRPPWVVGLLDLQALPRHLVLVLGSTGDDGKLEIMECAQHYDSEYGRGILENIATLLRSLSPAVCPQRGEKGRHLLIGETYA